MQDFLVILIVFAAAAFLAQRMWQSMTKRQAGACGACSNCPSNTSNNRPLLVNIDPIMSHAKPQRREDFDN
jgi:hypothetical protein